MKTENTLYEFGESQNRLTRPLLNARTYNHHVASLQHPHAPRHLASATRMLWGIVAFVPVAALIGAANARSTPTMILLGALALFWSGLCLVFFGSHLFRLAMPRVERINWATAMLFAAPIAVPMFWWKKVFQAPEGAIQHI